MSNEEEIGKLITWYDRFGATAGTDKVMKARDRLAVRSYRLAEFAAECKTEYNHAHLIRRIEVSRSKQGFITKGSKIGQADAEATLATQDQMQAELDMEAAAYRADILLRQVNQVLAAMQQRIAMMREEAQQTRKEGT